MVLQYFISETYDPAHPPVIVRVDDLEAAQVMVDQIVWAESAGSRAATEHMAELVSEVILAIEELDVKVRFKDKSLIALAAVETVLRVQDARARKGA